ncbi:hypothetical protein ACP0CQ_02015 [Metamycoplasma hominis]|uniref:hypothetical protein n=1 Tax=Metamycoplasma hominis TaxID=2098 RepID=UPI003CF31993
MELLKYSLITKNEFNNEPSKTIETEFVPYTEEVVDEFIHINFIDNNNQKCDLLVNSDTLKIKYSGSYIELQKNKRVSNKIQEFSLDFYLKDVFIEGNKISAHYDILVGSDVIASNIINIQTKTEK